MALFKIVSKWSFKKYDDLLLKETVQTVSTGIYVHKHTCIGTSAYVYIVPMNLYFRILTEMYSCFLGKSNDNIWVLITLKETFSFITMYVWMSFQKAALKMLL